MCVNRQELSGRIHLLFHMLSNPYHSHFIPSLCFYLYPMISVRIDGVLGAASCVAVLESKHKSAACWNNTRIWMETSAVKVPVSH